MPDHDIALMAHLMRRAGFGASRAELEARVAQGYEATMEELLHPERQPALDEDILYRYFPNLEGPLEYVQQGRFRCAAEPFEGPEMTKACIDILGTGALMHQSDYPHGEAYFPDTASMVINWPIWSALGEQTLRQHMYDNAAAFLRLL